MMETSESYMTATTTEPELKKPVKEVTVIQDQGFIQHATGDTYEGYFEVKKKDRSLKMHGPGVYKTVEGDIYTGTWENDRLGANDDVTISYVDTSIYQGGFKDWSYSGRGKYTYPDGSILLCDFNENMPVGQLVLSDPNTHTWLGKAEQGFGWFEPINHYYAMLDTTQPVKPKRREKRQSLQV